MIRSSTYSHIKAGQGNPVGGDAPKADKRIRDTDSVRGPIRTLDYITMIYMGCTSDPYRLPDLCDLLKMLRS